MKKIRVLVVDDSALMRKVLKEIIEHDLDLNVVGMARDGEDALIKARDLRPDIITMDINMPGMDGLTALQYIISEEICPVIMVSSLTSEGAVTTFEALELGAFDYVAKPGGTISLNLKVIENEITSKIKAAVKTGIFKKIKKQIRKTETVKADLNALKNQFSTDEPSKKAVVIGISTGGPQTLAEVMPLLPPDLDASVFIVQHMPANFTASFAKRLNGISKIRIKEVEAGDIVRKYNGYLAKGGYHLLLRKIRESDIRIRLSTVPTHLFIPSVSVMMDSVLKVYGKKTVGVLMTGMGSDGADAMLNIRNAGGRTIAESEETAIVFGMPMEAIKRGGADTIAPSYRVADEIVNAVKNL
ncbi:MAG: chemotaxis response regulator protein-glutamate methylesterase [Ignavibacteriaceae bacterium]|jgi:two-component system chemotaxis response regulator CheB